MPIQLNTIIHSPEKPYIVQKGSESVFYSPETMVGVRVNQNGAETLASLIPCDTPMNLANRISKKTQRPPQEIIDAIMPFLEKMLSSGYLKLGEEYSSNHISPNDYNTDFKPIQLYLHLTHKCNLSCLYCYNKKYRNEQHCQELTDEEIFGILEESHHMGIKEVIFTGGEPLLDRNILKYALSAQKLNMRVCLITNGTLIEEYDQDMISDFFDMIFISLDSSRETDNDALRGAGAYQKVVRGLQKLCSKKPDIVCLRPVITRLNVDSLHEMPKWAATNFGIQMILPTWYLPNSFEELDTLNLFISSEERNVLNAFASEAKSQGITNVLDCIPFTSRGKCGAGTQIISIDAAGEVFPCQSLHFPELSAGNVRQKSLKEIGRAASMRSFAEITVRSVVNCCDCGLSMVCGGGCRAIAYSLYSNIYAHNELLCTILRQESEERLWSESEKKVPGLEKTESDADHATRSL
jgi:radical SAM protein with 4Fe4S-binding SPASM domain